MEQKKRTYLFLITLLIVALACATPLTGPAPESPANVETIVAATFQALTQTPPLESTSSLLPHSLYYLSNDGAQISQIFRMDRDGQTITQLTFEASDVNDYDVSPIDGSLVYVWNNQLFTVDTNGGNRAMIVDGGAVDENNPFLTVIRSPVWSPDEQTIAYGHKGLNFYSIVSGQSNRVLDDQIENIDTEFSIPREMYWPEKYSADGSKLIVTLGYYEGASTAIYYPNGGALVRLNGDGRSLICCGSGNLSADGSFLFDAHPYPGGMFPAGLWRVDTTTGTVATLLSGDYDANPIEVAASPFPAPDGQLYFFYANVPMTDEMIDSPLLQLVRSGMDGVTGRTVLRSETFENLNEAIWAPDASFVIVAMPQNDQIYQGGAAQLFYMDERPMIPLVQYAKSMKWGP
jgi:Tol biopolymer transport system component